ncbi:M28 family peptidase [Streptomyces huiliensis]|uniref:M28 family peptidase n=1 Tax=Streptomyces huiliensis TaxID=2876027 RepID=UPI001CBBB121|nr:M28 family peptidase [Streptomyces huiliensis]MBZ4318322.1 M28 family peptidase [Streptomyces huiliensis]
MARRRTAAPACALACAALLAAAAAPAPEALADPVAATGPAPVRADAERLAGRLASEVTTAGAWRHLEAFQRAADEHGGVRAVGTEGYDASAHYVTRRLTEAGYRVRVQRFSFPDSLPVAQTARVTAPDPRDLHPLLARFSPATPDGGWRGRLAVLPGNAYGCGAADYAGDVRGHAVLARYGGCDLARKSELAAAAGAAALLVNVDQQPAEMNIRSTVRPPAVARVPTANLPRGEAERLAADAARGPVELFLDLRGRAVTTESYNLLADTPTGRADRTVVLGSHLDSATEGPGLNDNGSSAAMVLETALRLAPHRDQVRNRVRFAFWGAEEEGMIGSGHYVAQLSAQERRETALVLNFETIASPNYARMVYHGTGAVPPGTDTVEKVFTDRFARRGLPTVPLEFDGRSDFAPFMAAGIPAGGGSAGYNHLKTPEWQRLFGGTAGQLTDPCYHQTCDDLSHLDRTILGQFGDAMAWATARFAVDVSDVGAVRAR